MLNYQRVPGLLLLWKGCTAVARLVPVSGLALAYACMIVCLYAFLSRYSPSTPWVLCTGWMILRLSPTCLPPCVCSGPHDSPTYSNSHCLQSAHRWLVSPRLAVWLVWLAPGSGSRTGFDPMVCANSAHWLRAILNMFIYIYNIYICLYTDIDHLMRRGV